MLLVIFKFLVGAAIYGGLIWLSILWFGRKLGGKEPSDYLSKKCQRASDERNGPGSPLGPL